jgi:hypothetical protein
LIFRPSTVYNDLRLYTNFGIFERILLKEVGSLQDGTLGKIRKDCSTIHFEPLSDLPPPNHHPFVVMGVTSFKPVQPPFHLFASRGKDGKADHDKKNPLKERKKEAKDPESKEEPPDDHQQAMLELFHRLGLLVLYDSALKIKWHRTFPGNALVQDKNGQGDDSYPGLSCGNVFLSENLNN